MATAFAVYCDTDKSLNFYKRDTVPTVGSTFEGKAATAVYEGIETSDYVNYDNTPWYTDGNYAKITNITFSNAIIPISTAYWFYGCTALVSITNLSNLNTSQVTTMKSMFTNCRGLTSLDASSFNTSSVTVMRGVFANCRGLTSLNVSSFDTSQVTDMGSMFYNCQLLTSLDVSNFDTSKVTNMGSMFGGCQRLRTLDVSNFDTSKVTSMASMFDNCQSLMPLDVSNFDTSQVTTMKNMFQKCWSLTSLDVSSFDTSRVTDMSAMFQDGGFTSLDVSNFDTSNVTTMQYMFRGLNKVTSLDISNFNTSQVTNMMQMFYSCTRLQTIYVSETWFTAAVTSSGAMFYNCTSIVGDIAFDANYTDGTYATYTGGYLTYRPTTYHKEFIVKGALLYNIAEAVRGKTGGTDTIVADNLSTAITNIEKGVDTSDATATATDIASGKTAYVNGEKVTGTIMEYTADNAAYIRGSAPTLDAATGLYCIRPDANRDAIFRKDHHCLIPLTLSDFGDATAADVLTGKTFTSSAGLKVAGTAEAGAKVKTGVSNTSVDYISANCGFKPTEVYIMPLINQTGDSFLYTGMIGYLSAIYKTNDHSYIKMNYNNFSGISYIVGEEAMSNNAVISITSNGFTASGLMARGDLRYRWVAIG